MVKALDGAYRIGCEDGFACYRSMHKRGENADSIEFTQELVKSRAHGWSTCIPQSWNDVRQNYLEGSRSMLLNLPLPTIHRDVDGHSYVLISDCIRHFLGHQSVSDICLIPPQLGDEAVTHSSLSKRAQEILDLPHGALSALRSYILLWNDDVEPNRTKANRGSIWLMTATIATCPDNGHSMAHTYPIAVGKKGDDHDPVLNRLEQSLEQLRSGGDYYIGDQNKKARITFEVFATLQDQPERRDFNCMRAGNGTHTARFGVSADHGFLYREAILPSCKKCLDYMQKALAENSTPWPMPSCNVCVRWDALDDPNGLCKYRPPLDCPLSSNRVIETTRGPMIRPFKITYDTLKAGVDAAHEGFVSGGWSNQNCESYLEVEGLASKFIDNVLEHSTRNYSLALARAEPDRYQAIIDAAERNPMKYNKIPYPAAWSRPTMSLDLHPDVIMHLLFLGVVKTTIIQIQNCLSAQSKLGSFLKSTNSYLREFLSMSIEWLPIQPYQGGKLGGWVSENFLGFSRILPWFFQNIDEAVESTSDYVPPENLPQNKWLMRHLKYWLQVRGLDTKGKRDELQERVARYMADGAPDPLPAPDIPPASVEAVLLSLGEVLRCVMCPRVSPPLVNRTRYAIRVFLSHYDSLTRPLQQKTPAVLSSYNFTCLLNIPDAMERFGPLRCIWEGGPRGEGFARFAKPYMTQGLRQNWHYNLLLRLHRAKAFDIIMTKETKSMADISDKDALRHRKGCFQKYASAFSLRQQFSPLKPVGERKPLSVLLLKYEDHSTGLCSVVGDYDRILILGIPSETYIRHFGLFYYRFSMPPREDAIEWQSISRSVVALGFGMLLPLLRGNDGNYFALISSNWKSLSPTTQFRQLIE